MDHDVGNGELAQVENAADHVAVLLHEGAFLVMQLDHAAHLLVGGQHVLGAADVGTEQPQDVLHKVFDGHDHRAEDRHQHAQHRRDGERDAIAVDERVSLGQHLAEDEDE